MRHVLSIALVSSILLVSSSLGAELFVATNGDDHGPGTKERPLATLAGARDAVRRLKATTKEPVQVLFRGGTYCLAEEVVFQPEDSGTPQATVTYAESGPPRSRK